MRGRPEAGERRETQTSLGGTPVLYVLKARKARRVPSALVPTMTATSWVGLRTDGILWRFETYDERGLEG